VSVTVLRVADVSGTWTAVRLVTDLGKREPPRPFARIGDSWELPLPHLPVDRLEYLLQVEHADGSVEQLCAPGAPTVGQPFGDKSVLVLESYRAPGWLDAEAPEGTLEPIELASERLGAPVTGQLWTAPGLDAATAAPLVVALDGPEYVTFAMLDRYLAAAVATGAQPPLRAAQLRPGARNEEYSASDVFADALAGALMSAIEQRAPAAGFRIGLGASLGGLAMLHAHWTFPALFDGLVLQSGSFFDVALDGQENSYQRFDRITAFVRDVVGTSRPPAPVPVAITCGTGEENLANNRAMARALATQGYRVSRHDVRDGHTWTCWRDAFEPAFAAVAAALTR
jgi:enterochelin esterase family protein